ncbi:MAG: carboxypeptidase regulatory-like domain-containing protein [Actinomycetota bacterium]|nr:carboxypeptidase regulatory-like domain-containing protein [Actinomycetota bacterium]
MSLNVTNVSVWFSYVSIQKPDGSNLIWPQAIFSGGGFLDTATLPTSGTYTIFVDPYGSATGSITLTLYDVPADLGGGLTFGQAQTLTIATPGQNARPTFSGTPGQRVAIRIAGIALTPLYSAEVVDLLDPAGVRIGGSGAVSSTGWIDTKTLTSSGAHTVHVDPMASATGPSTVTVYDVPPDSTGSLSIGAPPRTATITVPGQDARLTFAGYADQPLRVRRSAITVTPSVVRVLQPDGTVLASSGIVGTPDGYFDTTLPQDGTYTVHVDGFEHATGSMSITLSHPEDDPGTAGADQSAAVGDDTALDPASPHPMSPTGPAAPGSYTTQTWSPEDTGTSDGLDVVSSTSPGTAALTGVAIDGEDGDPIGGATVTLTRGSTSTSTTTDSSGGYAFIDMPPGSYTVDVDAPSFGQYTAYNVLLDQNEMYQETAALLNEDQTFDYSSPIDTSRRTAREGTATDETWDSHFRPPPTIRVALYAIHVAGKWSYTCNSPDRERPEERSTYRRTKTYPWKYYVLRSVWGEIGRGGDWPGGSDFPPAAVAATASAVSNFAWRFRIERMAYVPANADIAAHENDQCFFPGVLVPFSWHSYVGDVLTNRVMHTADPQRLRLTFHLGDETCEGPNDCPRYEQVSCPGPGQQSDFGFFDPTYAGSAVQERLGTPAVLSQLGAKAAVEHCGVSNWKAIVNYYFRPRAGLSGGRVVQGRPTDVPPVPKALGWQGFGKVDLSFPSEFQDGQDAGWRYNIEKKPSGASGYRLYKQVFFDWHSRTIPTTWTDWTAGCASYRVRAWNPYGFSDYAYFNGGALLCGS